ncbi:phage tail protein [Salmonella enterica subsp. enterica]|nr:phage tail protein [Salmonella enterica subsp. enterica serovar Vitkin]
MRLKGLENAVRNLNSLDRRIIPKATAMTINRVAKKAVSFATHKTAKEVVAGDNQVQGVPFRLVNQRVKLWRASARFDVGRQYARIRINRGNLPAIRLGNPQVRLTRRKGKLLRRGSVLRIGRYLFRDAFVQQLPNGRWHVMKRINGKDRYPIDVVKIPLAAALTRNFNEAKDRIVLEEFPKELGSAIRQQFRVYATRKL